MAMTPRRFRLPALTFAAITVVAGALVATTGTTLAASSGAKPVVAGTPYLALGDSIAFGFRELQNMPTPDYSNAASFVGYPEDIAAAMGLKLTNASCPGETTSSFVNKNGPSNGCENHYDKTTGQQVTGGDYRPNFPLHARYTGSQLAFAKKFLKAHPNTRLVTLTVGANDAFLCQQQTNDGCIGEFGALQTTLKKNLGAIFKGIRGTGYTGQIVLLDYFSTDYSNSTFTAEVQLLDNALAQGARGYKVRIASGFNAFKAATAQGTGDTCAAQLITVLTNGSSPCGVHPSIQGQALLAQTVMAAVKK